MSGWGGMPPPFGFGGGKSNDNTNGTGYGGSNSAADRNKLIAGRKKAALEESKRDAATTSYLKEAEKCLKNQSADDSSKLVSTLKEVFRNQVPTDWATRKTLFKAALKCFRLVIENYSELLGDKDDDESLNAAFEEFSQHAHFLKEHDGGKEHSNLVKEVLAIQALAAKCDTQADLLVMDPHAHYRKALGPLRFDFVASLKHHHFASAPKGSKLNTRKMFQELSAYKTALPIEYGSSIFVRAVEDRLDLLRALIIGPEDTPYANGCFFFDIHLKNYPHQAPAVQFLTTGGGQVRFNPNLYNNGKVCLSLLGTWTGPGWIKGESTLLQVLVSIQSLILVNDPYFNEPGYARSQGTPQGNKQSRLYNANIRKQSLQHAVLPFVSGKSPYPEFDEAIHQHFRNKKNHLEKQLYKWMSEDSTLARLVHEILPHFARFQAKPRDRVARAPKAAAAAAVKEVNGVIELLDDDDDDDPHPRKKQKANEVVNIEDEDSKPAAVVQPPAVVLDLT